MQRRYIVVSALLLTFLLTGCGTKRRAQQRAHELKYGTETTVAEGPKEKDIILYPKDHDHSQDYYDGEDDKRTLPSDRGEVSDKKFTAYESANIRVAGVNPLPAGGVLELNLDKMQDEFHYPYRGEFLSGYGQRGRAVHTGIDIRTIPNDTIRAAFSGVVRMSKMYSSYGNIVVIQHYYGFETLYAHCSRNLVDVNDVVKAGDPIALGGRTGRATTEHLHFEVRVSGEHVDPLRMIDVDNQRLNSGMMYVGLIDGKVLAYSSQAEARQLADKTYQTELAQRESERAAAEQRRQEVAAAEKEVQAQQQFYRVQKGDTLYGIALRNKTTVKKLCEMNGIGENDILQINQRLRVK